MFHTLGHNRPPNVSSSKLSWWEAWTKALTQPFVARYAEIADSSSVRISTAYLWVLIVSIIAHLNFATLQSFSGGITPRLATMTGEGRLLIDIIVTVIFTMIGFAVCTVCVHFCARLFGGTATYSKLAYTCAAYTAPLVFLAGEFAAIPNVGYVDIFLGLYAIILTVIAVKAVNQLKWPPAVISSVLGWVIMPVVFIPLVSVLTIPYCMLSGGCNFSQMW